LAQLWANGAIYPCFCSRKKALGHALAAHDPDGQPHYGGICRALSREEAAQRIARGDVHGWRIDMARADDPAAAVWGDAMIAKRHVGSSYHIAVVTDDALQGVTHVVRGKDIEPATPLHKLLQRQLGLPTPHYHHHDLIRDAEGQKLSKSIASTALRQLRAEGVTPADIRRRLGFG
jgi:glutamyl-Q tRNA(Asp) synthetase